MTFARIVPIVVAIVVLSTDVMGQIPGTSSESTTSTDVTITPYPGSGGAPSQRVRTRRESADGARITESTDFMRDLNGRWHATATRTAETRTIGPSHSRREETIRRRDVNGRFTTAERIVSSQVETNGRNIEVIETYSRDAEGFVRADDHLSLSQRVRRTTTTTADGGRTVIEIVEGRNAAAPSDSVRAFQRTMTTVRLIGPARWLTERQVFELDPNGRMVLVESSTQATIDD